MNYVTFAVKKPISSGYRRLWASVRNKLLVMLLATIVNKLFDDYCEKYRLNTYVVDCTATIGNLSKFYAQKAITEWSVKRRDLQTTWKDFGLL